MTEFITLHKNALDIRNQRFGRLVALGPVAVAGNRHVLWLCRCDCGNSSRAYATDLVGGKTRSCGCVGRAKTSNRMRTHGMSKEPVFGVWSRMKTRCRNPNRKQYPDYGGRGITICDEWLHSFEAFFAYVVQLPDFGRAGYTLDRIDNDGNYEPGNVRWADRKTQSRNSRNAVELTYNGETMCIAAWAEKLHLSPEVLKRRRRQNWSLQRLLTPNGPMP